VEDKISHRWYSKTFMSFLMTFMGAGRILAYKPIWVFFYFPMDFDKLSFSQHYALQSMLGQCKKSE